MSNPWHGEIAPLSPLYLIRDNMGGDRAVVVVAGVGWGGGVMER